MGPEVIGALETAAPYIVAGAGTAAALQAEHVQANMQRNRLNQAVERTADTQTKTNAEVQQEAATMAPIARAAALSTAADTNVAQSKADLAAAGATDSQGNAIIDTSGDNGAVSQEFLKSKADRALSEGTRLSTIAQQLAKVRAPGDVMQDENQRRAAMTEDLGSQWASTKDMNQADANDAQGIQMPLYGKIGKIAALAAAAYGAYGGGGAAAGAGAGATGGAMYAGGTGLV